MVEQQVLHFLKQQNRPYSTQLVADNLAQFGVKKGPIQKALDSLSEQSKIICKEFGKTKIYMPIQDDAAQLGKEEMDAKIQRAAELTEKVKEEGEVIRDLKKALKDAQSCLTVEELESAVTELRQQAERQAEKLKTLQSGSVLIPVPERAAAEKEFAAGMAEWQKRRRIFRDIWNTMSENMEGKEKDLFEEMGIDTDETCGVDYKSLEHLLPKKRRI